MPRPEYNKIAEALANWLDSQDVTPADGIVAMTAAIGSMIGSKARHVPEVIEGLGPIHQMLDLTALQALGSRLSMGDK